MKPIISPLSQAEKIQMYNALKANPSLGMIKMLEHMRAEMTARLEAEIQNIRNDVYQELKKEIPNLESVLEAVKGKPGDKGKDAEAEDVAAILLNNRVFIERVKGQNGKSVTIEDILPVVSQAIKAQEELVSRTTKAVNPPTAEQIAATLLRKKGFIQSLRPHAPSVQDIANEIKSDLEFIEALRVGPAEDTEETTEKEDSPQEIAQKLNTLNEAVDWTVIKGLAEMFARLQRAISSKKSSNVGGGGGSTSASSGVGTWSTPAETPLPDGSVTVFTVGSSAPTDVLADGTIYPSGTAWTFLAGQITLNIGGAGPTQFIRYR